ncbi:MAG: N-formylglutamate deformylase [Gammaproteobacteria bacterium]|jgi:formiminoglutamase|nr:N-formylglutamate deformylase [Gammaproteobacteria bacterium]
MISWQPFELTQGHSPLVISMPHSGTRLTSEVEQGLTLAASLLPDTDWHIPALYHMAQALGATCISANYSRYVIDLNRPLDDVPLYSTKTTGLFPDILFTDKPLFQPGKTPETAHREACKRQIWQPYHQAIAAQLARIRQLHGYAILLDAHSIASRVPMLFDGQLPDFNWGTNTGHSCADGLLQAAQNSVDQQHYSQVSNARFKGGYITRHYGRPQDNIHAIQLELGQDTYLQEQSYALSETKLVHIEAVITRLVQALIAWRPLAM